MSENGQEIVLTKAQRARIEKNRQKAIVLKQTRLIPHPYAKGETVAVDKTTIKIGTTKYKDTGGGFLLEEEPEQADEVVKIAEEHAAIIESDRPCCEDCKQTIGTSYLFNTFDYPVCDSCRDEEKHSLITKTEAMKEYLLKDCDIEKREPPLKYITRKNPHNVNWGEMKLYLQIQVEKRALEVWGTEEALREELERREEKRIVSKSKKYLKEMKKLRMTVRSSLYDKTSAASHKHAFGPETYNEEDDDYSKVCTTCGFKEVFEKM